VSRQGANEAKQNLKTTNAIGATNNTEAQNLEATLTPTYTSMLNMGETPQQSEANTNAGMGAVSSAFGNAKQQNINTAARTHNASDLAADNDKLAMEAGSAGSDEANQLALQNNNVLQANRATGLGGLQALYGGNQQQAASMYGLGPSTINAQSQAYTNPAVGLIEAGLGAAGMAASGPSGK
jgi:hypothetical protein